MKSKAIGLRIPTPLWEQVSSYGCENFPKSDDEKRDFDITATLLELINKGLGNDSVEPTDIQTVEQIVRDIVSQNVQHPVQQIDEQSVKLFVEQTVELQLNEVLNELSSSVDTEQQIQEACAKATSEAIVQFKAELQPILEARQEFEAMLEKQAA